MVNRKHIIDDIIDSHAVMSVCAMLGPRQCGKTTIAREYQQIMLQQGEVHFLDLEDPFDLQKLENPKLLFDNIKGVIIIDEVQRKPELFPYLRVVVDNSNDKKFLLLGSASRELLSQSSESLAGRINYIEMTPFTIEEVDEEKKLWIQGGFPRSYLVNQQQSIIWRKAYIKTFLEQDIPNLGIRIPAQQLRRFWMMVAHYHGNIVNFSEIGNSLGLSDNTIRKYLDILNATFMVRILQPWYENISKRQVKTPKIYLRDSGLLHIFLNINDYKDLLGHPKLGASWEGFALEQTIDILNLDPFDCYFWATHNNAEIDLVVIRGTNKIGFEFKFADTVSVSKSMRIAIDDLQLSKIYVITPSGRQYHIAENIEVIGLQELQKLGNIL
jgi:predicted AAA+ superfamily ATPase